MAREHMLGQVLIAEALNTGYDKNYWQVVFENLVASFIKKDPTEVPKVIRLASAIVIVGAQRTELFSKAFRLMLDFSAAGGPYWVIQQELMRISVLSGIQATVKVGQLKAVAIKEANKVVAALIPNDLSAIRHQVLRKKLELLRADLRCVVDKIYETSDFATQSETFLEYWRSYPLEEFTEFYMNWAQDLLGKHVDVSLVPVQPVLTSAGDFDQNLEQGRPQPKNDTNSKTQTSTSAKAVGNPNANLFTKQAQKKTQADLSSVQPHSHDASEHAQRFNQSEDSSSKQSSQLPSKQIKKQGKGAKNKTSQPQRTKETKTAKSGAPNAEVSTNFYASRETVAHRTLRRDVSQLKVGCAVCVKQKPRGKRDGIVIFARGGQRYDVEYIDSPSTHVTEEILEELRSANVFELGEKPNWFNGQVERFVERQRITALLEPSKLVNTENHSRPVVTRELQEQAVANRDQHAQPKVTREQRAQAVVTREQHAQAAVTRDQRAQATVTREQHAQAADSREQHIQVVVTRKQKRKDRDTVHEDQPVPAQKRNATRSRSSSGKSGMDAKHPSSPQPEVSKH